MKLLFTLLILLQPSYLLADDNDNTTNQEPLVESSCAFMNTMIVVGCGEPVKCDDKHPDGQTWKVHWCAAARTAEATWYRLFVLYEPQRGPWPYKNSEICSERADGR